MSTAPLPHSGGLPDPAALAQLANDFFAALPNGEVRPERPERQTVPGNAAALPAPVLQATPSGLPEALPASPKSGLAQGVPQAYAAALPAISLLSEHHATPAASPYY